MLYSVRIGVVLFLPRVLAPPVLLACVSVGTAGNKKGREREKKRVRAGSRVRSAEHGWRKVVERRVLLAADHPSLWCRCVDVVVESNREVEVRASLLASG